MKTPRVFVSGADGFLGSYVVRELLRRQYLLRVLVEPSRRVSTLDGLAIERTVGDLVEPAAWRSSLKGCDYVIHLAADTSIWPNRSPHQRAVNIGGTQNMLEAAQAAGVRRFVHVGTANSFGFGSRAAPGHEGLPYASARFGLDYMDSKYEAQQCVLQAAREGFPALVLNPTFMLGAYDSKPGSNALILALYKQQVPACSPGGKNYLYAGDAAVAVVNALVAGQVGACYLLGHENLSYGEAFERIAGELGVRAPRWQLPAPLLRAYGRWGSLAGSLTGKPPKVNRAMAALACTEVYYRSDKAIAALGLPQTPIEQGVREAVSWFKLHKMLD